MEAQTELGALNDFFETGLDVSNLQGRREHSVCTISPEFEHVDRWFRLLSSSFHRSNSNEQ
jgi:hypothetical protein